MGEITRLPLAHAAITTGGTTTLSNAYGIFNINAKTADSVRISCAGYTYYAFKPAKINTRDTIIIYLKPVAYNLAEVKIKANRDFKAESLRMRKEKNDEEEPACNRARHCGDAVGGRQPRCRADPRRPISLGTGSAPIRE